MAKIFAYIRKNLYLCSIKGVKFKALYGKEIHCYDRS